MAQDKEYFAFISYQRKDEEWADRLRNKLEHYRLPSSVRKQDASLPKEIRPIFRDALELAGGVLAKEIETALQQSKYLIVICSPNSAKSPWVNKEIQTFIDLGREEYIIPFIIDGIPFSDNEETECFPSALRSLKGEKELLGININELGRDAAAIKVVARMFGLKFDTLWQRYEREKKRKRWMTITTALLITILSMGTGGYFIRQNRVIEDQNLKLENAANRLREDSIALMNHVLRIQNDSIRLSAQNDSISLQNMLILQQRNDLNNANIRLGNLNTELTKVNSNLLLSNRLLSEERDRVLKANWKMMENQALAVAAKADELTEAGNAYLASLLAVSVLPQDVNHPDRPITAEAEKALRNALNSRSVVVQSRATCAVYSPDGQYIAVANNDSVIRLLDAVSLKFIRAFERSNGWQTFSICFSPDGKKLASGDIENEVRIWDVTTGKCLHVMNGHTSWVRQVAFSPDGKMLASASDDNMVKLWNAETGMLINNLEGHQWAVCAVAFSNDGKHVISSSRDNTTRIWDVKSGICLNMLEGHDKVTEPTWGEDGRTIVYGDFINSLVYSPNGKTLATTTAYSRLVQIWDVVTGKCLETMEGLSDMSNAIIFSSDGSLIAFSEGYDKTARVWDVRTGKNLMTFRDDSDAFWFACFSPDGNTVVTVGGETVRIWDVNKNSKKEDHLVIKGTSDNFLAVYSPDGKYVASASMDENSDDVHVVKLWDAATGKCIKSYIGHEWDIRYVAFSPDGNKIVSASRDETARVWNVKTGKCEVVFRSHEHNVSCAVFSPDSKKVATSSWDGFTYLWNVKDGKILKTIEANAEDLSFNYDGKLLATASDRDIIIWDVENGLLLKVLKGHADVVRSVAFSPITNLLASSSLDKTIKIWDTYSGKCLKSLLGHKGDVLCVRFSPDGKYVVSASSDNSVIVWDVNMGKAIYTFNDHKDMVNCAFFSPDGQRIMSAAGGMDSSVIIRPFDNLQKMINATRERFKIRQLTPEERRKYYLE